PHADFIGQDSVVIHDVRDFRYDTAGRPLPSYETRGYGLDRIATVWFVVTPFERDWRGPAHAFLSFGFADSQFVAISVEARRELGGSYSMAGGLLKRFELLYVIGAEHDLLGSRPWLRRSTRGCDERHRRAEAGGARRRSSRTSTGSW
ncbi:MAG: DUF4105 domain-containing protein, partial [Longimicrobiales bacterium]